MSLGVSPIALCARWWEPGLGPGPAWGLQLLDRSALCEFLLKMLYANTSLLSGEGKVAHCWFMGLHVNPFQVPPHTRA